MRAKLLFHQKFVYPDGAIVEMRVWLVSKTLRAPEGIKYSLVYIDPDGARLLGYDNAEGKGHHRHEGKEEKPFCFESIEKLIEAFLGEIDKIRR